MNNSPKIIGRRRGIMSVMAMIFLVLFGALAIGFYSATTTQSQVAVNDQRVLMSQTAAESGMDFMRYQLGQVSIPPGTSSSQVINVLYTNLQSQLNGTGNLGANTISISNNVIYVPGSGSVRLDALGATAFTGTITNWGAGVVVKSAGTFTSSAGTTVSRAISMDFTLQPIPTTAFSYAVASAGQVVVSKNSVTGITGVPASVASIMSTSSTAGAITVSGGSVGGQLYVLNGATATFSGGSVSGSSSNATIQADYVHTVPPQNFPIIDTSGFQAYAVNTWASGVGTQQNVYVPPNTNPVIAGNATIQGIMFIASPNTVKFSGNVTLDGFIVFQDNSSATSDSLTFNGNVTTAALPAGAAFDPLRSISGIGIMAPTAAVTVSGNTTSYVRGNVIADTFTMSGAAQLEIDQGTLMTMSTGSKSTWLNGTKSLTFSGSGQNNQPTEGVSYNQYFAPNQSTYQEILP